MRRLLVVLGIALLVTGLLWPVLGRVPLGRLPGDLVFRFGRFRFYIPLVSSLLVSLIVTLILRWWGR